MTASWNDGDNNNSIWQMSTNKFITVPSISIADQLKFGRDLFYGRVGRLVLCLYLVVVGYIDMSDLLSSPYVATAMGRRNDNPILICWMDCFFFLMENFRGPNGFCSFVCALMCVSLWVNLMMTKDSDGKLPLPRSVAISERGRLERRGRGRVAISVDFGELKLHSRTRTKKKLG